MHTVINVERSAQLVRFLKISKKRKFSAYYVAIKNY